MVEDRPDRLFLYQPHYCQFCMLHFNMEDSGMLQKGSLCQVSANRNVKVTQGTYERLDHVIMPGAPMGPWPFIRPCKDLYTVMTKHKPQPANDGQAAFEDYRMQNFVQCGPSRTLTEPSASAGLSTC